MSKPRTHWWIIVAWDGSDVLPYVLFLSREKARKARKARGYTLHKWSRVIKVIAESACEQRARQLLRDMLYKYVTAPDKTKPLRLTVV